MAKKPLDPQATPFHLRPGVEPFGPQGWDGVNTEDDPGSLAPWELQRGENIRLVGKHIRERDALSPVVDFGLALNDVDNQILWMSEAPVDNPRTRLWFTAHGCFGTSVGTGASIFHIDPSSIPVLQPYANIFTGVDFQSPMGKFGDKLFIGDRQFLREIILITPPANVSTSEYLFSPSTTPVVSFPGYTIRSLLEFDGKLFIGLEDNVTPGASKIVTWNGLGWKDDLTGIRPPLAFGIWRDKLVCGFDSTAAHVRYRGIGSSPGSWTTVALGGFQCTFNGNAMAEYKQYLFIASGVGDIFRFDGSALSLVRNIAAAAVDGSGVTGVALHRGLLYYGWNTPGAAYASRIGRHDLESTGANEWIDTYKNVSTEQANFKQLCSIASYRSQIMIGGQQIWVLATPVDNPQGTLEVINNTGAPSAGSQVRQLLRFP